MPIITLDVQTDYPAQFTTGTKLYAASGLLIGTVTDSVIDDDADIRSQTMQSQTISRAVVRDTMFPQDI